MEATLNELFANRSLKFIFVGGKGGVGKTTTASSIALRLSQVRGKTLLISTDPAHNLSDAFNQQFSSEPTAVAGVENLFAMEIDPKKSIEFTTSTLFADQTFLNESGNQLGALSQIVSSFPGIDEAAVFMNLVRMAREMDAEVVVFDTAPTGHTLKLLAFPATMQAALGQVATLKEKLGGVLGLLGGAGGDNKIEAIFQKVEHLMGETNHLKEVMTNSDLTTFVAVCIPEFLSVYETERLVQELAVQGIDIFNIVVNQIVFFDEHDNCKKCRARFLMQSKYIKQIFQLYTDFHVCLMPLEDEEIRGLDKLNVYSGKLTQQKNLPSLG